MTETKRKVGYKNPPPPNPALWETPSPTELKILYFLSDLADERGTRTVEVYQADLAAAIGVTKRRAQAALAALIRREYILSQNVKNERGGLVANKYTILNPDRSRHLKIRQAAEASGIDLEQMVEYCYWLNFHRKKLAAKLFPTVGDIAHLAHCPAAKAEALVRGLITARILTSDREITF